MQLSDGILDNTNTSAAAIAAPAMPRSLEDLHEILQMYNEVTQRLQGSHERLEQEKSSGPARTG